ncbi:Crp/Fnr family transcriptional regulator [Dyella amyloliquefaciens]|uniref:Crp/Fnr family transcriptional regulator n=1 Tax=Dyella amyloliquefaciens TaxID=1770545 RepID=UPI0013EEDA1D|nr:Crp/Fnr family transcriptional regulator [Dyella amyloliquefaciens]
MLDRLTESGTGNRGPGLLLSRENRIAESVLHKASWAHQCSPKTIQTLLGAGHITPLEKGKVLFNRTDRVGQLVLVLKGGLAVSMTTREGREHLLGFIGIGHYFGVVPFFDERTVDYEVSALTASLVMHLSRASVLRCISEDPGFRLAIIETLCYRLRRSYVSLTVTSVLPVAQRCARALLYLVDDLGAALPDGIHISLKLSQGTLANTIGCSRPVLNHQLMELRSAGVIDIHEGHLVVLDKQALENLVTEEL